MIGKNHRFLLYVLMQNSENWAKLASKPSEKSTKMSCSRSHFISKLKNKELAKSFFKEIILFEKKFDIIFVKMFCLLVNLFFLLL